MSAKSIPRRNLAAVFTFLLRAAPATEPNWEANEVPATTPETRSFRRRTFTEYNRNVGSWLEGKLDFLLLEKQG